MTYEKAVALSNGLFRCKLLFMGVRPRGTFCKKFPLNPSKTLTKNNQTSSARYIQMGRGNQSLMRPSMRSRMGLMGAKRIFKASRWVSS